MGEKQIAGGDDKPKDDPRAGGGDQGGKGGDPGKGDPGKGGDGGKGGHQTEGGGGMIDPMPPRPQPQQIITGKKKEPEKKTIPFPRPGGGGKKL